MSRRFLLTLAGALLAASLRAADGPQDGGVSAISARAFGAAAWRETGVSPSALPLVGNSYFDVWMTADMHLRVWNGLAWIDATTTGSPGPPGAAASVTVGSVTTGAPGSSVSVVNSGTSSAAVLDFLIPRGNPGTNGNDGAPGPAGPAPSGAANLVLATPDGASGVTALRSLTAAYIPTLPYLPNSTTYAASSSQGGAASSVAASTIVDASVASSAGIVESKLALNFPTHSSANDPTAGQKAALSGSTGTPGSGNPFVTLSDPSTTNARPPTAHVHEAADTTSGVFGGARIPTVDLAHLASTCTGPARIIQWDGAGVASCIATPSGSGGGVAGPISSTFQAFSLWGNTAGTALIDSAATQDPSTGTGYFPGGVWLGTPGGAFPRLALCQGNELCTNARRVYAYEFRSSNNADGSGDEMYFRQFRIGIDSGGNHDLAISASGSTGKIVLGDAGGWGAVQTTPTVSARAACDSSTEGTIWYSSTAHQHCFCEGSTPAWTTRAGLPCP